jgi:hypothetical protein
MGAINQSVIANIERYLSLLDSERDRVDYAARINAMLIQELGVIDCTLVAEHALKTW